MSDLEVLREQWLREKPLYERFAVFVRDLIREEARSRGIICTVEHRTKHVASLLKKALRKPYVAPYDEITDKAGVRAVVTYHELLPQMEELIRGTFEVLKHENKALTLKYDELGYQGIHFEISLREDKVAESNGQYQNLVCEVQLQTRAQNLWADVSHELSYKPPLPPPDHVQRAIYRLVALTEIFDTEIAQARRVIFAMPDFEEAQILDCLERSFYRFTARQFDRHLSLIIIRHLKELLDTVEINGFDSMFEDFIRDNEQKLSLIFEEYADDERCNPLLFQPEALLIFERLEKDDFRLAETWQRLLAPNLLDTLAAIWGRAVPT